jgi:hypothetical protein
VNAGGDNEQAIYNIEAVKVRNRHWLQFLVASFTYVAANVVDYMFTIYGLTSTGVSEANPVAQSYMDIFGLMKGLLLFKLFMVVIILLGVIAIDYSINRQKIKFKIAYILYLGAGFTVLASSLWLSMS